MRTRKQALIILLIACCAGLIGINKTLAQDQASVTSETTQPITWGGVESAAAGSPINCSLGLTQYTIQINEQSACGSTFIETLLDAAPGVKLYVRYSQRVTIENGQVIADYRDESESPFKKVTLAPPYKGGTYYIAISNCATQPASFIIRFAVAVVDYFGPVIKDALIKGKNLMVSGCYFHPDAVIVVNGEEQPTAYSDEGEMPTLVAKKAGKRIRPGDTVFIQVKNPSGIVSQTFTFIRGAE